MGSYGADSYIWLISIFARSCVCVYCVFWRSSTKVNKIVWNIKHEELVL